MEYKYHPTFKHLAYFVIIYMFLRHQKLMPNDILLINSVILTLFLIILDHMLISGHISPFESLSEQYFDENEIIDLQKEIEKEEKEEKRKRREIKRQQKEEEKLRNEETVKLQLTHDDQVVQETRYIKNNHPSNGPQCKSHSEFVNITNGLDNFNSNTSNRFNTYEDEIYPEFMAYNQ
jgi:hypothetical protein